MKPIKVLHSAPAGLVCYVMKGPNDLSWNRFHNDDPDAYRELRDALLLLQHGLCGYCEQIIPTEDCQVEHVIPRSSNTNGHPHDLSTHNLLASCKGGTPRDLFGPETRQHDPDRFGDLSCGQLKGDLLDKLFIDPRTLPQNRALFRVASNGNIEADSNACLATGMPKDRVDRTIKILGLNCDRLKRAREKRWHMINDIYKEYLDNPQLMRRVAKAELLPDKNRILPPFFTTNRSYFMPFSEGILAKSNGVWV